MENFILFFIPFPRRLYPPLYKELEADEMRGWRAKIEVQGVKEQQHDGATAATIYEIGIVSFCISGG